MTVPPLLLTAILLLGQKGAKGVAQKAADAPVVTYPGFETTEGGGTRVFVELSKTVTVEEKKKGTLEIDYVLKGARILKRNNRNPLVTVHFNTPVERAQLTSQGRDVVLKVKLRAAATPTWKVGTDKEGLPVLQVEFPSGNYLPKGAPAGEEPTGEAKTDEKPAN